MKRTILGRVFLTISTTGTPERPATDLGFLLHKHPEKAQTYPTSHGIAHVFYPEASAEHCTAALLLEVDPVALVRRARARAAAAPPTRHSRSTSTTAPTPRPRCSPSR